MANKLDNDAASSRRRRAVAVLVMIAVGAVGFLIANIIIHPPSPETAPQIEAKKNEIVVTEQDRRMSAQRTELCHAQSVCKTFRFIRQECAISGNFNKCVEVKMGVNDMVYTHMCTDDGGINVSFAPDMPNQIECIARWAVPELFR